MKANKLFKKLALSGIALGAAAVTLTATTFAWYTSNTTVEITQIQGMTEAKADGKDIYVMSAKTYGTDGHTPATWGDWGPKTDPVLATTTGTTVSHALRPVSYVDGEATPNKLAFVPMAGTKTPNTTEDSADYGKNTEADYGNYSNLNVYEYTLRFHVASNDANSLYFSEFNFATKIKDGYSDIIASNYGTGTGIDANGKYFADLAKALKLTVVYQALNGNDANGGGATGDAETITFDLTNLVDYTTGAGTDNTKHNNNTNPHVDWNITTADAVGYYNKVMKTALTAPTGTDYVSAVSISKQDTATSQKAQKFADVTATGYVEVRFVFWLDGWDSYCYDCMRQQEFTFSFKADTNAEHSVISHA